MTIELPSDELEAYAKGEYFHAQLRIRLARSVPSSARDRWDFLVDTARGKRVVHVGCLDHEGLVDQKIADGKWLHAELSRVASECVGIDVDNGLITHLAERYGVNNIIFHDLGCGRLPAGLASQWDVVFLPDVLEHIEAPVAFLTSLREAFSATSCRLVVTVPNAFSYDNFYRTLCREEWINTDHFAWYSPYTLCKTVIASGWRIRSLHFLEYNPRAPTTGVRSLIRNVILNRRPAFADTLGLVCEAARLETTHT